MKTVIVVTALVSLVIAAPSLPGDGLENTDRTQDWHLQAQSSLPDTLRERKSPSDTSSILNDEALKGEVQNVDAEVPTPMARSFALKKPLIVKKKYGYQLYRDSEEEKANAESNESCGRQVKVKLCNEDDKLRTSTAGATHMSSDIHTTEDDVKHSIKMAKEAVENLQRDLKKMEPKTDMKMADDLHDDTELHADIEVARQALKHIHDNFENLESMSLHATSTRNTEDMHNVHLTIAKTEEERMAQWKEAMENIQKNVEIARNIEDSFKVASNHESMLHLDQSEAASTITDKKSEENIHTNAALSEMNNLRLAKDAVLETHHQEKKAAEDMTLHKATNEHLSEHNAEINQHIEDDMNTAPSEIFEVHLDNIKSQEALKSESHKIDEHEKSAETKLEAHNAHIEKKDFEKKDNIVDHHHQEKSSELHKDDDMLTGQSERNVIQVPSMKAIEKVTPTKVDVEKETAFKTSENIHVDPTTTSTLIKPLTSDAFIELQKSAENSVVDVKNEHHLKQEKSADAVTATDADGMIDFLAKSADHSNDVKLENENLHKEQVTKMAKDAENSKPEQKEHISENWDMKSKQAIEIQDLDNIVKPAEQIEHTHSHKSGEHNENVMLAKSVEHSSIQDHQKQQMINHKELSPIETVPAMKAAEEHLHHLQHMHNAHWAHENRHLDHLSSMKAAEEYDNEFRMAHGQAHGHGFTEHSTDHLRNSHLPEHSQIPSKMSVAHDFELANHQAHLHHPARFQHKPMSHSHLHEMNGMDMHSNFHPSMRDAMESFGSDHMFRWKPAREPTARGAYGSGLSSSISSSGAVGVFPNANVGGCGIPLLLSCSPSVVSGSLAKTHSASSYSAPSYRTEEDFGFHNKRDIKKTNDMRTTNSLRSPTIVKQKSSNALENKM